MTAAHGPDVPGHELGLGLDFGSTGLRAVFGRPGGPVRRLALSDAGWPWLLCEPTVAGPLPVTFPSLKSRLGSERPVLVGGVARAPDELVTGLLRQVRERVEAEAGGRITLTVVSVPVGYRSAQRTALLHAAHRAGLDEVRLIGDAMAAVIGHTEGRGSTTCLVYSMGYGGFELGLVRGARERYRALGHESASSTGGRAFDDAALTAMLRAARGRAHPARLQEADWLRLRTRVERIREELCAPGGDGGALLELDLGGGLPVQLEFDREVLAAYLGQHVRRTLDRAQTLLDRTAMDRREVDTLLLVGGGTRLEAVRSGVRGLGREVVRAPEDLLARGALLHASQLAGVPAAGLEGLAPAPSDTSDDTLSDAPRLSVTLLPPTPAAEAAPPGAESAVPLDVALARQLAEQGRVAEARALLEAIVSEAGALLESLTQRSGAPEADAEGWIDHKAARRLAAARDLLTEGRFEEAVQASHAAWHTAGSGTSGADVMDAMIGVHCAAAMASSAPEHFPDAERWLRCAYGHDPTNARVRELLAERTYRHAERLEGRGRREDAVEALERCLSWNPEHGPAQALLERISHRDRNHRDRGGVPR
ncbi:Hsp70 family protein [Streptomyces sp. NPDC047043]|uniref:Hsp70 family protein n=1 Tax=Streptomyces sp. NPDC047043 TaxID=3154497 RepID=UPI0033C0741B